jgi:hypothetical protein
VIIALFAISNNLEKSLLSLLKIIKAVCSSLQFTYRSKSWSIAFKMAQPSET